MKTTKILSLTTALLLFAGLACKPPQPAPTVDTAAEEAARKAAAEKAAAEEAARKAAEEEARKRAEEEARRRAEEEARRRAEAEKIAAFKAAAEKALVNIHFDFDKSDIKANDRAALQGIAEFMRANANIRVTIEGHCDERGTNEYNLALGNRRAAAALAYLKTLGITEDRFETISYGKEKPLCTESRESCWSQNRRCEFKLRG